MIQTVASPRLDKQIIADGRIGSSFIVALITTKSNTALRNTIKQTNHTNQKNLAIARFFVLSSMTGYNYNSVSVDHSIIAISLFRFLVVINHHRT